MHHTLFIAKRYVFAKGSNHAINLIHRLAGLGVVVGALALFIVLAGFTGLKDFSLQFTSYFDPDLKVTPLKGKHFLITKKQLEEIQHLPMVKVASPTLEERIFVKYENAQTTAYIKGIDSLYQDIVDGNRITRYGSWLNGNPHQIVTGLGIANDLQLSIASLYTNTVSLFVPKSGKKIPVDITKAFRRKAVINIGVYSVNEEQDRKYIFSSIELARELLGYSNTQYNTLELKLHPKGNSKTVKQQLKGILGNQIQIHNTLELNASLYKMLRTEHLVSYLVVTLIAIIALFNVAGAIIMMIIDKKQQIKTLQCLGATLQDIRIIFLLQGSLMTLIGSAVGLLLGVILVATHQHWVFIRIGTLPYPTKIQINDLLLAFVTISVIGISATALATRNITKRYFQIT